MTSFSAKEGKRTSVRARRLAARNGAARMFSSAPMRSARRVVMGRRGADLRRAMRAARYCSRQMSRTSAGGPSWRMRAELLLKRGQRRRLERRALLLGPRASPRGEAEAWLRRSLVRLACASEDPRSKWLKLIASSNTIRRAKASRAVSVRRRSRRSLWVCVWSGASVAHRRVRASRKLDQRRVMRGMGARLHPLQPGRIGRALSF